MKLWVYLTFASVADLIFCVQLLCIIIFMKLHGQLTITLEIFSSFGVLFLERMILVPCFPDQGFVDDETTTKAKKVAGETFRIRKKIVKLLLNVTEATKRKYISS